MTTDTTTPETPTQAATRKMFADLQDAGVQFSDIITDTLGAIADAVGIHGAPVAATPAIAALAAQSSVSVPPQAQLSGAGALPGPSTELQPDPNASLAAAAGTSAPSEANASTDEAPNEAPALNTADTSTSDSNASTVNAPIDNPAAK